MDWYSEKSYGIQKNLDWYSEKSIGILKNICGGNPKNVIGILKNVIDFAVLPITDFADYSKPLAFMLNNLTLILR